MRIRVPTALALLAVLAAPAVRGEEPPPDASLLIDDLYPEIGIYEHLYDGRLLAPSGVHCDGRRGEIIVADTGNDRIGIYDAQGVSLFAFADPGRLVQPFAVVGDERGRIYVLDADRARVKLYSYRGEFVRYLALEGFDEKSKASLTALALDANGDLYVGNSGIGEIGVFDAAGVRKRSIGSRGVREGQFSSIQGIALTESTIYVSDAIGVAVQLFDKYGRFQSGWGRHDVGSGNVSLPAGIAVDAKGRIFLVDTLRHEIKAYTPGGRLLGQYCGKGRRPGEVMFPAGLSTDGKGILCVVDKGNNRVELLSVRDLKPKPSPAGER